MQTTSVTSAGSLLDTGPLVAALDRRDPLHEWAAQQLRSLQPPLLSCEAVLSEAGYLMRRSGLDESLPLGWVTSGTLQLEPSVPSVRESGVLRRLMERYSNVPMSFADACLVRLAERNPGVQLLTFDSGFRIYRTTDGRAIPLLTPGQ